MCSSPRLFTPPPPPHIPPPLPPTNPHTLLHVLPPASKSHRRSSLSSLATALDSLMMDDDLDLDDDADEDEDDEDDAVITTPVVPSSQKKAPSALDNAATLDRSGAPGAGAGAGAGGSNNSVEQMTPLSNLGSPRSASRGTPLSTVREGRMTSQAPTSPARAGAHATAPSPAAVAAPATAATPTPTPTPTPAPMPTRWAGKAYDSVCVPRARSAAPPDVALCYEVTSRSRDMPRLWAAPHAHVVRAVRKVSALFGGAVLPCSLHRTVDCPEVCSATSTSSVWRQYSDFEALNARLRAVFPTLALPTLPLTVCAVTPPPPAFSNSAARVARFSSPHLMLALHACVCVRACACVCMCVCMCVCACVCVFLLGVRLWLCRPPSPPLQTNALRVVNGQYDPKLLAALRRALQSVRGCHCCAWCSAPACVQHAALTCFVWHWEWSTVASLRVCAPPVKCRNRSCGVHV